MRTVVVYPGRFQPMLGHHAQVYEALTRDYTQSDVYLGTSDKVEQPKSPFNFIEKRSLITLHGVPQDHVLKVKSPYNWQDYTEYFSPDNTILIFILGPKDAERLTSSNTDPESGLGLKRDGTPAHIQDIKHLKDDPQPMSRRVYVKLAPKISDEQGQDRSASAFREKFKSAPSDKKAKEIFTQEFGGYDESAFHLVNRKLRGNNSMNEHINRIRTLAGLSEAAPIHFGSEADPSKVKFTSKPAAGTGPDDYSISKRFPPGADVTDPDQRKDQFLKELTTSPNALLGEINSRLDPKDENSLEVGERLSNVMSQLDDTHAKITSLNSDDRNFVIKLVAKAIKDLEITEAPAASSEAPVPQEEEEPKESLALESFDLSYLRTLAGLPESAVADDDDDESVYPDDEDEGVTEMDNRTPSGDRREQRANSPEEIAKREKEQQASLKKVSPEMRKKLRLPEPKQGVAEGDVVQGPWGTEKFHKIINLLSKFDGKANHMGAYGNINKKQMAQALLNGQDVEEVLDQVLDAYHDQEGDSSYDTSRDFQLILIDLRADLEYVLEQDITEGVNEGADRDEVFDVVRSKKGIAEAGSVHLVGKYKKDGVTYHLFQDLKDGGYSHHLTKLVNGKNVRAKNYAGYSMPEAEADLIRRGFGKNLLKVTKNEAETPEAYIKDIVVAEGSDLDQQVMAVADKLTSGKNLEKLQAMRYDSTVYRELDRYFAKNNIPENIYNRVANIVFKRINNQGVAEGVEEYDGHPQLVKKLDRGYELYATAGDHSTGDRHSHVLVRNNNIVDGYYDTTRKVLAHMKWLGLYTGKSDSPEEMPMPESMVDLGDILENYGITESEPKPDFLDLDHDGDTQEPMKQAAKGAEEGDEEHKQSADESFRSSIDNFADKIANKLGIPGTSRAKYLAKAIPNGIHIPFFKHFLKAAGYPLSTHRDLDGQEVIDFFKQLGFSAPAAVKQKMIGGMHPVDSNMVVSPYQEMDLYFPPGVDVKKLTQVLNNIYDRQAVAQPYSANRMVSKESTESTGKKFVVRKGKHGEGPVSTMAGQEVGGVVIQRTYDSEAEAQAHADILNGGPDGGHRGGDVAYVVSVATPPETDADRSAQRDQMMAAMKAAKARRESGVTEESEQIDEKIQSTSGNAVQQALAELKKLAGL